MEELDKEAFDGLNAFFFWCNEKFGCTLQAWIQGFDTDKNERVDKGEFLQRTKANGFEGNPKQIFNWLIPEQGKKIPQPRGPRPEGCRGP
jgi:hypothetical protein